MKKLLCAVLTPAMILLLNACAATGNPQLDSSGEPSYDGLLPVTGTTMQKVWARPGVDLRDYDKFMAVGAGLQFRPVQTPSNAATRSGSAREFPLTPAQQERIRAVVSEQFSKALESVTVLQRVDEPGPNVLMVRGAIIDIVSRVPPDQPGRSHFYLDSVGHATFVVELIDSETGTVLVRGIDTRSAETPGYKMRANRASNMAEVRKLAAYWARLLADGLNRLATAPSLTNGDS